MKLSLSENISKLRKKHSMTQEQLADALGVTFASVSKWERGVATPELHLIAEMADLFEVSLDALVGFDAQSSGVIALDERIAELQREKKCEEAIIEAEKALLRYPNDFRIVYRAGNLYGVAGTERKNDKYLTRCIDLLERSIFLLSQNTNPKISEAVIKGDIAQYYIILGNVEKGIDILKKYNVRGIYDALIAIAYTGSDIMQISNQGFDIKEAEPYMTGAFFNVMTSSMFTMLSYADYYFKKGNYISSRETYIWLANMLEGMKIEQNTVAYVDKVISLCYFGCAKLSIHLGEREKVESYLRQAYKLARAFDAAPTYGVPNMRFCVGDVEKITVYDDFGDPVIASIEKLIAKADQSELLHEAWNKIIEQECAEVRDEK